MYIALTKPSGFNKIYEVLNGYCCEGWGGFAIKCDTFIITQCAGHHGNTVLNVGRDGLH